MQFGERWARVLGSDGSKLDYLFLIDRTLVIKPDRAWWKGRAEVIALDQDAEAIELSCEERLAMRLN